VRDAVARRLETARKIAAKTQLSTGEEIEQATRLRTGPQFAHDVHTNVPCSSVSAKLVGPTWWPSSLPSLRPSVFLLLSSPNGSVDEL